MSKCFTCGQNMPQTTKQRIEQYKKLAEVTGKNYVYFETENGNIGISQASGFVPKEGKEFALVTEFNPNKNDNKARKPTKQIPVVGNVPVSGVVETPKQGNRTKRSKPRKAK